MAILATILLLAMTTPQAVPPRAGVLVTTAGRGVLAMPGAALATGTTVTLVTIDSPQAVSQAVVGKQLPDSDVMAKHETPPPYYQVTPTSGTVALPGLAVAILGRFEVQRLGSTVALRVGNGDAIHVRGCTSSEGLHLTVWRGEPLTGARLWHAYYYLGYDVEPTCRPGDFQDGR